MTSENPNLFTWATSELSQDAFICWLLAWVKPEYKGEKLNTVARELIYKLSGFNVELIEDIEIKRQYENIDILVIINSEKAILIEDKVNANTDKKQLSRYYEIVRKKFGVTNISCIYFKTGNQDNYDLIEQQGYLPFKRSDFLELLNKGKQNGIQSDIYLDFLDHLESIENETNSYQNLPFGDWKERRRAWEGFFMKLQESLEKSRWNYVPQKDGGFMALHWCVNTKNYKNSKFHYYVQLEEDKLCFKIVPLNLELNLEMRDSYRNALFPIASECGIKIKKNGRCTKGKTKTMTVAKLEESYIETNKGLVDIDSTVKELKKVERVIEKLKCQEF